MDPNKIRPKERIRENEELSGNWKTKKLKR